MHEWALAESVIKTIETNSLFNKKSNIEIVFGELQDIEKEIFSFALKELIKNEPILLNIKFKIVKEKAEFKCNDCGKKFTLKKFSNTKEEKENIHFLPEMASAFIKCPYCKSRDFEIVKGRGLSLRIKEKDEH